MSNNKKQQRGDARVQLAIRNQIEMRMMSLEQMVPENHFVRTVVRFVESLDLSELYERIKSKDGVAGRTPIDPRILFSLWLFATLEGETSGRRIATLTERDTIYMYLCGGVSVNYHTICDFRVEHADLLERVLTDSIAALHSTGLIKLETVAQDGMRVRAAAGSSSFRREGSLKEARKKAKEYLQELNDDKDDADDDDTRPGRQAARSRGAKEKIERIDEACAQMEDLKKRHEKRNRHKSAKDRTSEPRASTTDPDARRMKMGDTGFRPAFNVQFANDADALVIIGVDVTNEGTDSGQLEPMYESVCERYDVTPKNYLADGGFRSKAGVSALESKGTNFFGPLPNEKKQLAAGEDPYTARPGENALFTAYRQRMGTDEAKDMYRRRAAAAEFPNANCRNHGLHQFRVRGLLKAKAQSLWHAIAYNFRRFCNLKVKNSEQTMMEVLFMS